MKLFGSTIDINRIKKPPGPTTRSGLKVNINLNIQKMSNQPNVFQSEEKVRDLYKVPEINGKQYFEDPQMKKLAESVLDDRNMDTGPAQIGYMLVYPNISKTTAAKCKSTSLEEKHFSGFDYLVQVSGEMWDMLDATTKDILLWHELLHIDPVFKAKNQQWTMKLRKPDFKDFYLINDKLGNTWIKTIQSTVSSLYDLDPKQESKVKV